MIKHALPWLEKKTKVAVIGDLMLDEYLWGEVSRISPEAPVPVHLVQSTSIGPGGAANVALNIKSSGAEVELWGRVGNDESSTQLNSCLTELGVVGTHFFKDASSTTTKKTRIVTGSQQIARVDREKGNPLALNDLGEALQGFESQNFDVVVISDYEKGFVTREMCDYVIKKCQASGTPVIVDPKAKDFSKYRGAYMLTPNLAEAKIALRGSEVESLEYADIAKTLVKDYEVQNVLVTLGAQGMVWAHSSGKEHYLPAMAREVFDVSGAGDTVIAVVAMAVGAGASMQDAMRYATYAANIVVQKKGTKPVSLEELSEAVQFGQKNKKPAASKILPRSTMGQLADDFRSRAQKVVFTNGCFDILHAGHVEYLEEARKLGDVLVVGINSDESIKRIKGPQRPIIPCEQRAQLLAALSCVDYVVIFEEDTPLTLIETVAPQVLVKGADWKAEDIVGGEFVKGKGGVVDTISVKPGISTTEIIERIRKQ